MDNFKKLRLLILIICLVALIAACGQAPTIETDIGSFEYSQEFMQSIDDTAAAEGNTLLVVYLKPVSGGEPDLDAAQSYFFSGTQATLAGQTYDLKCIAYERVNNAYVRIGLVFEVEDNGYEDAAETPAVQLKLPKTSETE